MMAGISQFDTNVQQAHGIHFVTKRARKWETTKSPFEDANNKIIDFVKELKARRNKTQTLQTREKEIENLIAETLLDKYKSNNWDGYNAVPLSNKSIEFSKRLLENLPKYIPIPEVDPHNDGDLGLYWEHNDNTATLSINKFGVLSFATLDENDVATFGTDKNFNCKAPEIFIKFLESLYN